MPKQNILCIIPARYSSTRLPGKPLADIAGKPMIWHVYQRCIKANNIDKVLVATDDARVFSAVEKFSGNACMTSTHHKSGTDRLAEVAQMQPKFDIIVNVQGDEPLIDFNLIDDLVDSLKNDDTAVMATAKTVLKEDEYDEPSVVKVLTDANDNALYFSRSLIPYPRNKEEFVAYKHIGIYAYKRDFLLKFASMPQSTLEKTESLEQLRALENGYKIKVITTNAICIGVDTKEDLQKVNEIIAKEL